MLRKNHPLPAFGAKLWSAAAAIAH